MVQNAISPQKAMGTINRIGNTQDGRGIYEIKDPTGKQTGKISIAAKDCDTFEKSYNDLMEAGPKLQEYMQNTTPEALQKKQKKAKWTVGLLTAICGGLPLLKCPGSGWVQIPATIAGILVGLMTGSYIARKTLTPPGADQFNKATQNLSKIDIQPYQN